MIESPDMGGSSRSWASQRATRTQAMPTKSLFGSILEMTDEKQLQEMKAIDLAKYEEEKSQTSKWTGGSKTKVHFRDGLPGVEFLKERRGQFTRQSGVAQKTQEELNFLEEKSKYFQLGVDGKGCQNNNGSVNPNPWFSENDLKNAKEMNNVQAYGNHKRQPVKHNYSLIGDMFSPGMEFIDRENKKVIGPEHYKRPSYGRGQKGFNQTSTVKSRHNSAPPSTAMDLPPNIRHLFGTKICEHLLSDKNKVEKTMTDQQQLRDVLYRKNKGRPDIELPTIDADPQYEALGNALRTNVFPGFTFDNKISTTKKVYSREVHNSRQPDPDEFRYQRDHLSTWAEQNVLRDRMKKAWDVYLAANAPKGSQT